MYKCIIIFLLLMISGCMDVSGSYDNDNINNEATTPSNSIYIENQYNNYGTTIIMSSSSSISTSSSIIEISSNSNISVPSQDCSGSTISFNSDGKSYLLRFENHNGKIVVENLSQYEFKGLASIEFYIKYSSSERSYADDNRGICASAYGLFSISNEKCIGYHVDPDIITCATIRNIRAYKSNNILWHGKLEICKDVDGICYK